MRITVRAVQAAAVAALAVLAVGCGSSDSDAGGNGNGVVDQVININGGAEPPSLDPGLATDTTSGDVITNVMSSAIPIAVVIEANASVWM